MVKHGMTVQMKATQHLNPGQIPVTAFDAPLFTLANLVQWKWPDTHGESKHVVMMGGLHVEMAMWNTFGDYLEGQGGQLHLLKVLLIVSLKLHILKGPGMPTKLLL